MRRTFCLLLLLTAVLNSGCQMMKHLAPHQLWKLNRQPPMAGGDDVYFSVPAPDPEIPSS